MGVPVGNIKDLDKRDVIIELNHSELMEFVKKRSAKKDLSARFMSNESILQLSWHSFVLSPNSLAQSF